MLTKKWCFNRIECRISDLVGEKLQIKLDYKVFSLQLKVKTVTLERSGCLWIGTVNGRERAIPELSPADNRRWRIFSG
jgi:hypothetical protein